MDLGTANTLIIHNEEIVVNEPSIVALDRNNPKTVLAVGKRALMMHEKTHESIRTVRPLKDGVIADFNAAELMIREMIKMIYPKKPLFPPSWRMMICIPSSITEVEKRAVRDSAEQAGAKEVYLLHEPMAAALGIGIDVEEPVGNMIIDIGGGTSEIAVIALGGIVVSDSLRVGGNRFDESIANYIRRKYNLMIGDRTAEDVKIQVGSALPLDEPLRMEVKGRDMIAGLPRTIPITSTEITEAIEQPLQGIITAVRNVLEQTPPELSSDIIDKGMVMTGGGALLRNLDKLLTQVTGIPCHVAENALNSVAVGTGMALEHFGTFRKSLVSQS